VCRDVEADVPADTSAYSINTGSIPQRTFAPVSCHASTRLFNSLKPEVYKYCLLLLLNRRGNWFLKGVNLLCFYLYLRLSAVFNLTLLLVSFRLSRNGTVSIKHWDKWLSLFTVSDKKSVPAKPEILKSIFIRIVGIGTKISKEHLVAYHFTLNMKAVALFKALLPYSRLYCTAASKTVFIVF
jgi:hypothetical protein